uniref:RNA-directed DNA polymerase, eukaryota, reverse transcriptase zinc-binding domain protein n=1 Tax=Tanacetum cinerariifolium TaxID=118510 RepID=A0A699GFV2_TANCI|nr:hypothetical protein [Tanacetum cinerariifolium]
MVSLDVFVVKNLWGNMLFDFTTSSARGRSGSILCVWDKLLFPKMRTYATEHCLCVEDSWNNDGISASNTMILFKNKLKILKQILKEWSSIKKRNKDHDTKVIQDSLIEIYLRHDKGDGLLDDLTKRANLFRDLKDIDHKDSIDLAQKAKIKWAVEGDENSKFFHGIMNKKRSHLTIKGILVDGEWIENPNHVKSKFHSNYSNLFSALAWDQSLFDVEDMVSNKEIKRAVWDSDKSPGQMDLPLNFLRNFRLFLVIGDIVSQEQSTFIKGRQIMDDTLVLNEVISWCNDRMEQLLMFKVDFQKAFDSVRLDHLDDILGKFSFGIKWRGIYGVGVRQADVQHMAKNCGCESNNLPITYLDVKVGANMMRLNSWSDVVKKVSNKLSNWKSKTLFIRGGLGVNSLYALNLPSIFKWIWRFSAFSSSLWIKVIKSIHGNSGALTIHTRLGSRIQLGLGFLKLLTSLRRPPCSGIENLRFIELGKILSSISLSSAQSWQVFLLAAVRIRETYVGRNSQLTFLAIVYDDASTSSHNVSSEPSVSIYDAIQSDINFNISFSNSEDKDYVAQYNGE